MKNMTLTAIANACNGTYYGCDSLLEKLVDGVVIDSRKVEKNFLFIPIKGARADGHDFIPQVMASGALCTLSEHHLGETDYPYIVVASCTQALKDLAEFYRCSLGVKVVGITGSVGKTSTKEMIASVLSQKYSVLKTEGNYNNEIGLPLTIFRLTEEHDIAILEMGINQFGEMRRLAKVARPDICVLTNIGYCHLEYLHSREGVLQAKSEIFEYMNPQGSIVLNGDDDLLSTLTKVQDITPLFFGMGASNTAYASKIEPQGLKGTHCTLHLPEGTLQAIINIPGAHMVHNALAGILVGHLLGLTLSQMEDGIQQLVPVSGRNNLIETQKYIIIDDCYNANPVSMKASLDVLSYALSRKVAVLGDMGELGKEEDTLHHQVGVHAGSSDVDVIICIGKLAKHIEEGARSTDTHALIHYYQTKEEFLSDTSSILLPKDTILVKASHSMDFGKIVDTLKEV